MILAAALLTMLFACDGIETLKSLAFIVAVVGEALDGTAAEEVITGVVTFPALKEQLKSPPVAVRTELFISTTGAELIMV